MRGDAFERIALLTLFDNPTAVRASLSRGCAAVDKLDPMRAHAGGSDPGFLLRSSSFEADAESGSGGSGVGII
jgi:hypothetical protein